MNDPLSYVYCPPSQGVDADACRGLLDRVGAALWITPMPDGVPSATLLPTLWRGDRLIAHASGHNQQFATLTDGVACRVVVQGDGAYVSPRWYPSIQPRSEGGAARGRAEGRAVGTWNYEQAQFAGVLRVHHDRDRLREEVTQLGHTHDDRRIAEGCPADAGRGAWRTDELPPDFFDAMLRGIVGLELEITDVVGRFKLAQNRTQLDRDGVIDGLIERGRPNDLSVAGSMRAATPLYDPSDTSD